MSAEIGEGRVRQASRIAARVVDGKAVVVVIDARELHTLNEVGTFIWQRMQGEGASVVELADAVVAEFEVERELAERDLSAFIEQLSELGVVEVRP